MSRFKRALDVVGACGGLLVFQERLGYRRCPFSIIKIRTMRDGRAASAGRA